MQGRWGLVQVLCRGQGWSVTMWWEVRSTVPELHGGGMGEVNLLDPIISCL